MAFLGASPLSAEDWQKQLGDRSVASQRREQAKQQAIANGDDSYSWTGPDGSSGFALLNEGSSNTPKGSSASGGSLFGGDTTGSLFGSLGIKGYDDLVGKAKDLARFNLGLDFEKADKYKGIRDFERTRDTGRAMQIQGQQITGTQTLEDTRQGATTDRLVKELANREALKQMDIDHANNFRERSAALALRPLGG